MSTEIDFKTLWNKEEAKDIPDTKELFKKADDLKKRSRNKLIGLNLMLLATMGFIIWVGFNIDNERLTTKIGVLLISVAIISYLFVYNQMIPSLFKTNLESSSQEYLNKLIAIQRKQEFLNKVMINVYFILLSAGMALYMIQFAMKMSTGWAIFYYVVTFAWFGFAWFYLRPRRIKQKLKALNDVIAKLEAVNKQLRDSD